MAGVIVQPGTGLQGPQGATGATGATGPTGPNGPAGPAGGAVASATEVEVTVTTGQTVLTYTPTTSGPFLVGLYLRVITAATTVSAVVTYTDATGAQSKTLQASASLAVGSYPLDSLTIDAVAGDAISVVVTAGTIDQVYASAAIWGTASSGSGPTIASYDETVLTKLSLAPVAYWKLDEAAGATTAADSSGNGYTLTVNGTVTFGEPSVVPSDSETCALGGGGYLEAATLPALIPVGNSPFTVIAIAKTTTAPGGATGMVSWNGTTGPLVGFSAGFAAFWSTASAGPGKATEPANGQSHLWGACWDGGSGQLSIDGPSPLCPGNGAPPTGTAALYLFAYAGPTDFFAGYLGRVAIFAGVLTPKDWALLMQAFTGVG